MKFEIKNRWSGDVQFTAEIDCSESAPWSLKVGLAVKWARENNANLRDANLSDANLRGANLSGANLRGAYLSGAYLSGANLRGANLSGAYLRDANLSDANLRGANLSGANLRGANLRGAYLRDANLSDGLKLTATPVFISDLPGHGSGWSLGATIWPTDKGTYLQIGCELHPVSDWAEFSDERIIQMDGKTALKYWRRYKPVWLAMCKAALPSQEGGAE